MGEARRRHIAEATRKIAARTGPPPDPERATALTRAIMQSLAAHNGRAPDRQRATIEAINVLATVAAIMVSSAYVPVAEAKRTFEEDFDLAMAVYSRREA